MPDRTDFEPDDIEALLALRSRSYDLVMNGEELGGGSIRINDRALQDRVFKALGLSDADVSEKFGFFLKALEYGAPPHGGIALGVDRVVAMILGTASIREVIAFPKNRSAYCPMTQAPSRVATAQLEELGLLGLGGGPALPVKDARMDLLDTLAWVSRIKIDDPERSGIAAAVEQATACAQRIDANGATGEPLFSVAPVANRTREGTASRVSPLADNGDLFKNAPAQKGGYFKVAAVLD
jgi:aspartyl-tRNA synthetase